MTHPNATAQPPPGLADDGSIAIDAECLACGYNLRGMDPQGGQCPECGKRVADSFDLRQLRFARREQLIHLHSFVRSAAIVPFLPLIVMVFWLFAGWGTFYMMLAIIIAAPTALLWFYLPNDSAERATFPLCTEPRIVAALDRALEWRRIAAITLLVTLTLIAFASMGARGRLASGVVSLSLTAMAYISCSAGSATLQLLSELAHRLPAGNVARLLRTAGRVMLAFAQIVCGAYALSALWAMSLSAQGLGCLYVVAAGFAAIAFAVGGPAVMIFTAVALTKFARRLKPLLASAP